MSAANKVAVIAGASQGIGAGLVRGILDRGYRVVANSRSIKPEASANILAGAGDIAEVIGFQQEAIQHTFIVPPNDKPVGEKTT